MIIANPTHVAVALKYDKEKMAAPVVVAKGVTEMLSLVYKLRKKAGERLHAASLPAGPPWR